MSTLTAEQEADIRDMFSERIYQFGSPNSTDRDFFVDIPFDVETDSKEFRVNLLKYKNALRRIIAVSNRHITEDHVDIVFIKIESGKVVWSESKDVEETQNSIYYTFKYHPYNRQYNNVPVDGPVKQSVSLKAIKVVRTTLTLISRTDYRDEVKKLLKEGTFDQRAEFLTTMMEDQRFSKIEQFGKRQDIVEIYKDLAFYYAQLFGLMNDQVVFTKLDACVRYGDIAKYILRLPGESPLELESFIKEVLEELTERIVLDTEKDHVKFEDEEHYYSNKKEEKVV